jgi:hypothetical protein
MFESHCLLLRHRLFYKLERAERKCVFSKMAANKRKENVSPDFSVLAINKSILGRLMPKTHSGASGGWGGGGGNC